MFPFPFRMLLISALAAIGLLAAVSNASATVAPPEIIDLALVVNANQDDDTIVLATSAGVFTVNGVATNRAANTEASVIVNPGGGNDTVDASALGVNDYRTVTVNGGEGNDLLTGGAKLDTLKGEGGDDRLTGFLGPDVVSGGEGNDLMVWNNKDNTDVNDGGPGVDEVEVNGASNAADAFTVGRSAGVEGATVRLERTNLASFKIDLSAERLTVNGLGGDDGFKPDPAPAMGIAGLTAVTFNGADGSDVFVGSDGADLVNGGGGNDSLFAVDGNDQINGGDGNDTLEGEGGDDRLVGGPGTDTVLGDEGDDVLVWNNGDGSDENHGGSGFDRVEVNGSPTAGDAFTLEASESGATFKRTNLVPFTLTIRPDAEQVAVNGGGGDDVLGVQQVGSRVEVLADGGAGKDQLNGGNEADSFFGGSGDDALSGADGSDLLDGGEGADRLLARDKAGDLVRGGAGGDSAETDEVTLDAIEGVETLDATPAAAVPPQVVAPAADGGGAAADKVAPVAGLGKLSVFRSHGDLVARALVSCPSIEAGGCRTALTLTTAKAIAQGQAHKKVVLGSKTIALRSGQSRTVTIKLAAITAKLASRGSLATQIRVASSDASGNSTARSQAVSLRIPRH